MESPSLELGYNTQVAMSSNYSFLVDGKEFFAIKVLGQRFCNLYKNATKDFKSLSKDIICLLRMIDELGEWRNHKAQYEADIFEIVKRLVSSCELPLAYFEEMQVQQEKNHPSIGYDEGPAFMNGVDERGKVYTCIFRSCLQRSAGFPYFWNLALHLRQEHQLSFAATGKVSTAPQLEEECWQEDRIANDIDWEEMGRSRRYQTFRNLCGRGSPWRESGLAALRISLQVQQRSAELSVVLKLKILLIRLCGMVDPKYILCLFCENKTLRSAGQQKTILARQLQTP